MTSSRPTLLDVAVASGVSRATVSFVLNASPGQTISAETQERVRNAARDLGYVPNGVARALREGASRIVLFDANGLDDGGALTSFLLGLRSELAAHEYVLLIRPASGDDDALPELVAVTRPKAVVRLGDAYPVDGEPLDGGWTDGLAAHSSIQVRHLIDRGHRHIAFAMPEQANRFAALRLRYAEEAALGSGCARLTAVTVPTDRVEGPASLMALLAEAPEVTAVAAYDDEVAMRVLAAAHDAGIRVPERLAVIGFDDIPVGGSAVPALTTVHIDAEAYGRRSARTALGLDHGPFRPDPATVVVRAST